MAGRERTKGNGPERNAPRTQGRAGAPSALERVRQAAKRDRKQRCPALLHHVYDVERLRAAYLAVKRDAAAGVDGETWQHDGADLEANLQDKRRPFRPAKAGLKTLRHSRDNGFSGAAERRRASLRRCSWNRSPST